MGKRIEENAEIRSMITKKGTEIDTSSDLNCWNCYNLGAIEVLLSDISKSLAVIADKLDKE